jgi:hypothetical protein
MTALFPQGRVFLATSVYPLLVQSRILNPRSKHPSIPEHYSLALTPNLKDATFAGARPST